MWREEEDGGTGFLEYTIEWMGALATETAKPGRQL